jgi:site-specific DNA-methyltransferase (adenine-specific)
MRAADWLRRESISRSGATRQPLTQTVGWLKMAHLYNKDCLEVMPLLEAGSVDAIITDLPYGTTACEWDSIIPLAPMWEQVKRVLKPSGAFITTSSQPFTSIIINSNIEWFRNETIWEKERPTNPLLCNKQVLKYHENILLFSKSQVTYNPQMSKKLAMNKRKNKPREYNTETIGNKPSFSDMCLAGENEFIYPSSIQYFTMERGLHPTQKPVALYEYLIRTYTNPNELILDICMGSGTTGVAAVQTGREFIGIEKERKYFVIAEKRIGSAHPPLFTEQPPRQPTPLALDNGDSPVLPGFD